MIEVKDIRKAFGPIVAADRISFAVGKGDVLGFLGPNGAGKSTTMKILSCFLKPDSGTASIVGHDILREPVEVRKSLGYLAENAPAYEEMTVAGFLGFVCDMRGLRGAARRQAFDVAVERTSIANVLPQTVGTLSKGYRRRVGLAQALVHDPPVLILDEPTDGLDPNQKHEIRELIKQLAPEKCIVISTHILEEVDAVCNRIVLIDRGQVLEDSTPQKLRDEHGGELTGIFRKLTTAHREGAVAGGAA